MLGLRGKKVASWLIIAALVFNQPMSGLAMEHVSDLYPDELFEMGVVEDLSVTITHSLSDGSLSADITVDVVPEAEEVVRVNSVELVEKEEVATPSDAGCRFEVDENGTYTFLIRYDVSDSEWEETATDSDAVRPVEADRTAVIEKVWIAEYDVGDIGLRNLPLLASPSLTEAGSKYLEFYGKKGYSAALGSDFALKEDGSLVYARDENGSFVPSAVEDDGGFDINLEGEYQVTYVAEHPETSELFRCEIVVRVVPRDKVTFNGLEPLTGMMGTEISDGMLMEGVTACDYASNPIPVKVTDKGGLDYGTPGEYTLTYEARYGSGPDETVTASRLVKIVKDGRAPELTSAYFQRFIQDTAVRKGEFSNAAEVWSRYFSDDYTYGMVVDEYFNRVPVTVESPGFDGNTPGKYRVYFSAVHRENPSVTFRAVRTVTVLDMEGWYRGFLIQAEDVEIQRTGEYDLLRGVSAYMSLDNGLHMADVKVLRAGGFNPLAPGRYSVVYEASYNGGDYRQIFSRTITVLNAADIEFDIYVPGGPLIFQTGIQPTGDLLEGVYAVDDNGNPLEVIVNDDDGLSKIGRDEVGRFAVMYQAMYGSNVMIAMRDVIVVPSDAKEYIIQADTCYESEFDTAEPLFHLFYKDQEIMGASFIIRSGQVDLDRAGNYSVMVDYWNPLTQQWTEYPVSCKVLVLEDKVTFSGMEDLLLTVQESETYQLLFQVSARDTTMKPVTVNVLDDGGFLPGREGSYLVTYRALGPRSGREYTAVKRFIVSDSLTTGRTSLEFYGVENVKLTIGTQAEQFDLLVGVTARDPDNNIEAQVILADDGNFNPFDTGIYQITYKAVHPVTGDEYVSHRTVTVVLGSSQLTLSAAGLDNVPSVSREFSVTVGLGYMPPANVKGRKVILTLPAGFTLNRVPEPGGAVASCRSWKNSSGGTVVEIGYKDGNDETMSLSLSVGYRLEDDTERYLSMGEQAPYTREITAVSTDARGMIYQQDSILEVPVRLDPMAASLNLTSWNLAPDPKEIKSTILSWKIDGMAKGNDTDWVEIKHYIPEELRVRHVEPYLGQNRYMDDYNSFDLNGYGMNFKNVSYLEGEDGTGKYIVVSCSGLPKEAVSGLITLKLSFEEAADYGGGYLQSGKRFESETQMTYRVENLRPETVTENFVYQYSTYVYEDLELIANQALQAVTPDVRNTLEPGGFSPPSAFYSVRWNRSKDSGFLPNDLSHAVYTVTFPEELQPTDRSLVYSLRYQESESSSVRYNTSLNVVTVFYTDGTMDFVTFQYKRPSGRKIARVVYEFDTLTQFIPEFSCDVSGQKGDGTAFADGDALDIQVQLTGAKTAGGTVDVTESFRYFIGTVPNVQTSVVLSKPVPNPYFPDYGITGKVILESPNAYQNRWENPELNWSLTAKYMNGGVSISGGDTARLVNKLKLSEGLTGWVLTYNTVGRGEVRTPITALNDGLVIDFRGDRLADTQISLTYNGIYDLRNMMNGNMATWMEFDISNKLIPYAGPVHDGSNKEVEFTADLEVTSDNGMNSGPVEQTIRATAWVERWPSVSLNVQLSGRTVYQNEVVEGFIERTATDFSPANQVIYAKFPSDQNFLFMENGLEVPGGTIQPLISGGERWYRIEFDSRPGSSYKIYFKYLVTSSAEVGSNKTLPPVTVFSYISDMLSYNDGVFYSIPGVTFPDAVGPDSGTESNYLRTTVPPASVIINEKNFAGVRLMPGIGLSFADADLSFNKNDKGNLSALVTISGESSQLRDGEIVMNIPRQGEMVIYRNEDGSQGSVKSEYDLYLNGPLVRYDGGTIPYDVEYMIGGRWVDDTMAAGHWESVTSVKIKIPSLPGRESLSVLADLSAPEKDSAGEAEAYLSLYWGATSDAGIPVGGIYTDKTVYRYRDYGVSGKIWTDKNEDGMQNAGEPPAPAVPLEAFVVDGNGIERILDATVTDEGGRFTLYTSEETDIKVRLKAPSDNYVVARYDPMTDNRFVRNGAEQGVYELSSVHGDVTGIVGGIVPLPAVALNDVRVQPGQTTADSASNSGVTSWAAYVLSYEQADDPSVATVSSAGAVTGILEGRSTQASVKVVNSMGDIKEHVYQIYVGSRPRVTAQNIRIYEGETIDTDLFQAVVSDADDDVSPGLSASVSYDLSAVDTSVPGNYLVRIRAQDSDGNESFAYAWVQVYGRTAVRMDGYPVISRMGQPVSRDAAVSGVTAQYSQPEDIGGSQHDWEQMWYAGNVFNQQTATVNLGVRIDPPDGMTEEEYLRSLAETVGKKTLYMEVPGPIPEYTPDRAAVAAEKDLLVQGVPILEGSGNSLYTHESTGLDVMINAVKTGVGRETNAPMSAFVEYTLSDGTVVRLEIDPALIRYSVAGFAAVQAGTYGIAASADDSHILAGLREYLSDALKNMGRTEGEIAALLDDVEEIAALESSEQTLVRDVVVSDRMYTVTFRPMEGGSLKGGAPDVEIEVAYGGNANSFPIVEPNAGYRLDRWADQAGETVKDITEYSIMEDTTFYAEFKKVEGTGGGGSQGGLPEAPKTQPIPDTSIPKQIPAGQETMPVSPPSYTTTSEKPRKERDRGEPENIEETEPVVIETEEDVQVFIIAQKGGSSGNRVTHGTGAMAPENGASISADGKPMTQLGGHKRSRTCILHYYILFLALIAEINFMRRRKKHQEEEFEMMAETRRR